MAGSGQRPPCFEDSFVLPQTPGVTGTGGGPRLLLLAGANGWTLPRWVHPARSGHVGREAEDPFWPAAIQAELRRRLGVDVSVLHGDLLDERDPATGDRRTVFVLENHRPQWTPPPGARWVGRGELAGLSLAPGEPREAIEAWLTEAGEGGAGSRGAAAGRPPWQRPGWYAGAVAWIDDRLRHAGLAATGPIEQLGTKVGRCLLRAPTTAGAVYFKALPAMYAREPRLLELLATARPVRVPALLAADTDRHWHLTRDHGGRDLAGVTTPAAWEGTLRAFAALQLVWTNRADALRAAGCPDLRLEVVAAQIEPLLADASALLVGEPGGLTEQERSALVALTPRLRAACHRLAAWAVPASLVHGDLLPENVALAEEGPVFLDWCEASLSHPFFSPVRFLAAATLLGRALRDDPALAARLRDAYLEPWTTYAPPAALRAAFELARPLQALQYALTYWHLGRALAAEHGATTTWERRGVAPRSLRRLLTQQGQLPPA